MKNLTGLKPILNGFLGTKCYFLIHDRSMILRLARWRGDRESLEIFETCWQDLNLRLTLFSWAERVGLIEPIKS